MKKYALLHIGFKEPTPDVMSAWRAWFERVAERTVENIGLRHAREIDHDGVRNVPMGLDTPTGLTIVKADSIEEAEALARSCPFVSSILVYEIA